LESSQFVIDYIHSLVKKLKLNSPIKFSSNIKNVKIQKVAICSGAGLFMVKEAKLKGAELFITSDINYHGFFDETDIVLADIGHYGSEKHAGEVIANLLKNYCLNQDFTSNMIFVSKVDTNPITYAI
jgi:putative NIF3 family GTP cyclohydrolase 1 type 2